MAEMCNARLKLGAIDARCGLEPHERGQHLADGYTFVRDFGRTPKPRHIAFRLGWSDDPGVTKVEV